MTEKFKPKQFKHQKLKPPVVEGEKPEAVLDETLTVVPESSEKAPEQQVEVLSTPKMSGLSVEEQRLKHNLGAIKMFGPVTVERFEQLAGTSAAKTLLEFYINGGLVRRYWKRASGRYVLTELGETTLQSLDERDC